MKQNFIASWTKSKWWRHITVEPALILYFIVCVSMEIINLNMYLQKACRNNATVEPSMDSPCDDEKRGIKYAASANAYFKFIVVMLMAITTVLFTSWSDAAGKRRKPLILLPIVGEMIRICSALLQSYFWYWSPMVAIIVDVAVTGFSGGHILLYTCCMIYVSDITTIESRTMRIGIITALQLATMPVANGMAGVLIHHIGFFKTYLLCLLVAVIQFVYVIFFVEDHAIPAEKKSFLSALNLYSVVESFRLTFKKSLGPKRKVVALLMLVYVTAFLSGQGEGTVLYLYLRHRFHWNEVKFSYYMAYKLFGITIGTIFCSVFLSRHLQLHDGLIGVFAGFWDTVAALAYLFADQTWQLYLIPLLDIFHGTANSIRSSFITKFYEPEEFGQVCSAINMFTFIIPIAYPIYNITFTKTMDFFPSAYFIISILLDVLVCIEYGAAYYLAKKYEAENSVSQIRHVE